MTDTVLEFARKLPTTEAPWRGGRALCLACRNYWPGAAPVEAERFECPACGKMEGVWTNIVPNQVPKGSTVWQCGCGGWHFWVNGEDKAIVCCECGKEQRW